MDDRAVKATKRMDIDKLKALIDLVGTSPISELELDDGTTKVRITRASGGAEGRARLDAVEPRVEGGDGLPATAEVPAAASPDAATGGSVLSPMTGVFYRRPSPNEPPFVEVGTHVERGGTLALIEAMKTLNRVVAERDGVVRAILVEDGAAVEDDQPLFTIE